MAVARDRPAGQTSCPSRSGRWLLGVARDGQPRWLRHIRPVPSRRTRPEGDQDGAPARVRGVRWSNPGRDDRRPSVSPVRRVLPRGSYVPPPSVCQPAASSPYGVHQERPARRRTNGGQLAQDPLRPRAPVRRGKHLHPSRIGQPRLQDMPLSAAGRIERTEAASHSEPPSACTAATRSKGSSDALPTGPRLRRGRHPPRRDRPAAMLGLRADHV